jgi:hypothetical protein
LTTAEAAGLGARLVVEAADEAALVCEASVVAGAGVAGAWGDMAAVVVDADAAAAAAAGFAT